jgi:hypothetical protein
MDLETENLHIIQCNQELLLTAIQGNDALEAVLKVNASDNWTEFGAPAL